MRIIAVLAILALSGCTTTAKVSAVRAVVAKAVDTKMDLNRDFICNITSYRAEMSARLRWNVKADTWNAWCGRTDIRR